MLGKQDVLQDSTDKQIILCDTLAVYDTVDTLQLFPSQIICCYEPQIDEVDVWETFRDRRVIVLEETVPLHSMLIGIAKQIKYISAALPAAVKTPAQAIAWAKENAVEWRPVAVPAPVMSAAPIADAQVSSPEPQRPSPAVEPVASAPDDEPPSYLHDPAIPVDDPLDDGILAPLDDDAIDDHRRADQYIWQTELRDDGWPAPIDLLGIAKRPVINPRLFAPEIIADHVIDHAARIGCDPSIPLISCVAAITGIVSDDYKTQPRKFDTGWKETCRLWGIVCGASSSKKNPGMESIMKPLEKLDESARQTSSTILKRHIMDTEIYKLERAEYQRKKAKGEVATEPPEVSDPEGLNYFLAHDFTVEGMRKMLQMVPKCLFYSDEAPSLIGSLGRYSASKGADGADRAHLLGLYQGGVKTILRQSGNVTLKNWSASLLIGTTPSALRNALGGGDAAMNNDGLMQRLIVACAGDATSGQDRLPDEASALRVAALISNLHKMIPGIETVLKFSNDAVAEFNEFEKRLDMLLSSDFFGEGAKSHMAKFRGIVPRLALLYQLIEIAGKGQAATDLDKVSVQNVRLAIAFAEGFQFEQLQYFWNNILTVSHRTAIHARWIAAHIVSSGVRQISISYLSRNYRDFRTLDSRIKGEILTQLSELGWLRQKQDTKLARGIPSQWEVNPLIPDLYDQTEIKHRLTENRKIARQYLVSMQAGASLQ